MKHVVALSGGADSTAMSLRLQELYPQRSFYFVCTPTGDELPDMEQHWRNLAERLGTIKRLPGKTLFDVIEGYQTLPNFRMRFCTRELKIEPFLSFMEGLPDGSVMYVGLRADEPDRLGMQQETALDSFSVRYPMREWGWSRKDVEDYLACHGVIIPARTDCGCCFYQRLEEWKALAEQHPERYQRYVELEQRIGHTFRSPGRDTWPASLADLREEFKRRPLRTRKKIDRPNMCAWCSR